MTDFPHASLAYLTEPTPGQAVINVQTPDGQPASPIGVVLDDMVMG